MTYWEAAAERMTIEALEKSLDKETVLSIGLISADILAAYGGYVAFLRWAWVRDREAEDLNRSEAAAMMDGI